MSETMKKVIEINQLLPKITIVTVVYNGEKEIEETILSVIDQTYKNIEYLVIDGASKDNTVSIVKKYDDRITRWISEPDKGIYDAMNKAINIATGEWINFMNAGDVFASNNILEQIFVRPDINDYDFVYGEHVWKNKKQEFLVQTRPLDQMWQRISFCHQSLFTKTALMKEKPFDLSYKIVCDYENYFSRYMEGKKFYEVDFPISVFLAGGLSDINFMKRTKERYRVVKKYKNNFEMHQYYFKLVFDNYFDKIKRRLFNAK